MISAIEFWDWFKRNNSKFFFLNQIEDPDEREKLLDEFLTQLHMFCDQLFFEIGGHPDDIQDLIISAEGKVEFFPKVEELVQYAPKLTNWRIIAFKPPVNEDFVTEYEGVQIDPTTSYFMPLENKSKPSILGIRLFVDGYEDSKREQFLGAAYQVLDCLLGEKENAENIQHVEVRRMPNNPDELGLIELMDLPKFVRWKKSKQ